MLFYAEDNLYELLHVLFHNTMYMYDITVNHC